MPNNRGFRNVPVEKLRWGRVDSYSILGAAREIGVIICPSGRRDPPVFIAGGCAALLTMRWQPSAGDPKSDLRSSRAH
jgi:hypothetical protein